MQRKIIFLVILSLLASTVLFAGTTGRIAGKVKDENGNAIAFATVLVEGLNMGANTDDKGAYIIINIPPGQYNIICRQMGYQAQKFPDVQINVDETTVLNVTLNKQAVEMEEFKVVERKQELVKAQKTNSGNTVTAESIEDLTVDDFDDIVAIQAGVSQVGGELHFRGGRTNEVQYTIDGMSVSDPVDGGNPLTLDPDAVEVTNVMTGGFTAEYGNAQSGVINVVTKSGSSDYSGKLEMKSDHLLGGDDSNSDIIKFSFGGPLLTPAVSSLREKLTFFMNINTDWYDTRYKDYYQSDPVSELKYLVNNEFSAYDPYEGRDELIGFDFGQDRNYNDYGLNFKMKYKFNPFRNLTFAVRGGKEQRDIYTHNWKYALKYSPRVETNLQQYVMTYDHTFNPKTNLKLKGSIFKKEFDQAPIGVSEDSYFWVSNSWPDFDPNSYESQALHILENPVEYLTTDGVIGPEKDFEWRYIDSAGNDYAITEFTQPGSIWGTYIDDENEIYTARADLEYQLNLIHSFKTGFEIMKHKIVKDQLFNPWVVDSYRYDNYLEEKATPIMHFEGEEDENNDGIIDNTFYIQDAEGAIVDSIVFETPTDFYSAEDQYKATLVASGQTDGYEANPWQGAYYLQDSMQWEGMIVNAGLRFDFWYLGNDYKKFENDGSYEIFEFDDDDKFQIMMSPRLGISHPISESSVLHFAYNYQNQLPQMQYIFTSKTPTDAVTEDTNVIIGNASLKPQITITYEVGLQKSLSETYVMDINAYYKNIYNYVTTQKVFLQSDGSLVPYSENPQDQSVDMYQYISEDYGSARGIDFNLQRSLANFISGSASYSLGWAQGNNSDVTVQDEATSLREFPLDWDIRHSFNLNLTFKVQKDEDWYIPKTDIIFPMDDFSINFSYNISSGKPYTQSTPEGNTYDTNDERLDFYEEAGLKFNKKFSISKNTSLKFYLNIENLFNRNNELDVYAVTGSPYYDGADLDTDNDGYVSEEAQYIHDLSTKDPSNVTSGRKYTVGVSFNW